MIISAPFGNYLRFKNCISTLGTYTLKNRGGILKRFWKIATTVRYNQRTQSWINKLGMPNPGISSLKKVDPDDILSICGFSDDEWIILVEKAINLGTRTIELNLSCPNITSKVTIPYKAIKIALSNGLKIIAKLPPIRWMGYGLHLNSIGVTNFHLCNTIPTPGGGLSGKILMQYSLAAIEDFRFYFNDSVYLIGGGGITSSKDITIYLEAGANDVSIGSALFNPINILKLKYGYF